MQENSIEQQTIKQVAGKGGKQKYAAGKGAKGSTLHAGAGRNCGKGPRKETPQRERIRANARERLAGKALLSKARRAKGCAKGPRGEKPETGKIFV